MGNSGYRVERGSAADDGDRVISIWRGNLGQVDRLAAKYDWFYRRNPFGDPLLLLLWHQPSSAMVGVAAAGPRLMQLAGKVLRAGVLVDMAVMAEHRSLFPALMLQKQLMVDGMAHFEILYGFPNPKAAAVFKRVGYAQRANIVRYAAVVLARHYLARCGVPGVLAGIAGAAIDALFIFRRWLSRLSDRSLSIEWIDRADERMDKLSAATQGSGALHAIRDSRFLRWRFDESPKTQCRYLCISDQRQGTGLLAWFACQKEDQSLHVRDFWSIDGVAGLQRRFLSILLSYGRRAGYASVSMEFLGDDAVIHSLRAAGFEPRGSRPVFCTQSAALPEAVGLHLTSADEDE